MRRLAARVPAIDIFGNGYVLRDDQGWEITPAGREFLGMLEAVTQDNLPSIREPQQAKASELEREARSPRQAAGTYQVFQTLPGLLRRKPLHSTLRSDPMLPVAAPSPIESKTYQRWRPR